MAAEHALRVDEMSFAYDRRPVLMDISLDLEADDLAYVVGPSGSGKTTLLRLAHGQLRPRSGRLTVGGGLVAMVFQEAMLLPRLTALENVAYAVRVANLRIATAEARRRARAALRDAGLEDRLDALPSALSAGQRQRVAVARAAAVRPALLLADEPTANLDTASADVVLRALERAGGSVLIATCDADLAGRRDARLIHLEGGTLVEGDVARRERCAS